LRPASDIGPPGSDAMNACRPARAKGKRTGPGTRTGKIRFNKSGTAAVWQTRRLLQETAGFFHT